MNTTNSSGSPESSLQYWRRVLRPLSWWLLLVLVLFAIRTHQRLMEKTRLNFAITLAGQPPFPEATATFDGQPMASGEKIPLGNHQFMITHPKGVAFKTNLFVWYGGRDFGKINLPRATGTLAVSANPPAPRIYIQGPEFNVTLTNSEGLTTTVPTDQYAVLVQYRHWQGRQSVNVLENNRSLLPFTPSLGSLQLSCNQSDATYQLVGSNDEILESGEFPATLVELPANAYKLVAIHHNHRRNEWARVNNGTTNPIAVEFKYGTAVLETQPPGASVTGIDGHYFGVTPLKLIELQPGIWTFDLQYGGYESVRVPLQIVENESARFQTNLISLNYASSMQTARNCMATGDYVKAAQATRDALTAKPNDLEAAALNREARGLGAIKEARTLAASGDYIGADKLLAEALGLLPGNNDATKLLAEYKTHEPEQLERQRMERLKRPQSVYDEAVSRYKDANLFEDHKLKTKMSAAEVKTAIIQGLKSSQPPFQINRNESPKPETYVIEAAFELPGLLGSGTTSGRRQCLIVCGQTTDQETEIHFKVLEYKAKTSIKFSLANLLNTATTDNVNYIPIHPTQFNPMPEKLQTQLIEGLANVTAIIQLAIGQTTPPTTP